MIFCSSVVHGGATTKQTATSHSLVNFFRKEKLCRRDYLDYLKNRAKSGDMAVL